MIAKSHARMEDLSVRKTWVSAMRRMIEPVAMMMARILLSGFLTFMYHNEWYHLGVNSMVLS